MSKAKLAIFKERVRAIKELDAIVTDNGGECSDDLLAYREVLVEKMADLGEQLGLVTTRVVSSEGGGM